MDTNKYLTPNLPERAACIKPFIVMDVMEKAQEMEHAGKDVVHLEVGEPDFDTPPCVIEAAERAIRDGKTHYTHSMGLKELRVAISEDYLEKYGVEVSPDCIIVSSGTSPAMNLLFSVLVDNGKEVVLTDPHYACYPNFIRFAGGIPKYVETYEERGFQYRADDLKKAIGEKTSAVIVNSPSNPVGALIDPADLEEAVGLGIPVISDEIYHGLVYKGKAHSALEYSKDNVFVINGFSKLYAMTGWRVGYVIAPRQYIRAIQVLHQSFIISANSFVQWAAISALKYCRDDVERMLGIYDERRKFLIAELKSMGFNIPFEPTGAFYVFVNARHLDGDSFRLCMEILEKARVAVTPGVDFGPNGEGFIRFSYASSIERIAEGTKRLRKFLEERKQAAI